MFYKLLLVFFQSLSWFCFRFPSLFISTITFSYDPFSQDPFALYVRSNYRSIQIIIWFGVLILGIPMFFFTSIFETHGLSYGSLIPLFFIFLIFLAPSFLAPRLVALGGSLITLLYFSFFVSPFFESNISPRYYFFEEVIPWLSQFGGFDYHLAVDSVSIYFITLTNFITAICILASWNTPVIREKQYFSCFLLINFLLIHVFTQVNIFLFFVFFEAVLIPMFFVIGVWGSRTQRIGAAYRFFLYTLAGSSFFLAALSYIYVKFGTLDLTHLLILMIVKAPCSVIDPSIQLILWFFIFIGFAVKIPLVPVHTWLPEAHVEAPTAGSMLLAGVLLKMGGYGVFRFLLPLFPDATAYFFPFTATLCILSIIYGSAAALVHQDMKKIVAYSSVAHMGYSMLGIFSMTHSGIYGGIGSMISHGFISTALFYSVGLLYERYGTRNITSYGSIALVYPVFSSYFFVFCLANTGFPGTSSFFPEIAVLTGLSVTSLMAAFLSATSVVLSAGYSLWLFARVCFAMERFEQSPPVILAHGDLSYRESYIAGILLFFIIVVFGFFPSYFFGPLEMPVSFLLSLLPFVSK